MRRSSRFHHPPARPQPRPARRGFLAPIERFIRRYRLGPSITVIGVGGLFLGTLSLAIVVAFVLRAIVVGDALNPFRPNSDMLFATPNATPNPDFLAPTLDLGNAQVWQGTEPVTVLLLGADTRPAEDGIYRPRTDTIILLMADPVNNRASMLSIPRDLYVDIPGYGLNRVNSAYTWGGAQLAVDTVQYNLGIRVNHYILLEFQAFVTLVDEIGGIDVEVTEFIDDPDYPSPDYGYDPFYISPGFYHMDGETALKYARTRATAGADFDRARRQQQVIFAIRDRVLSLDMLPTLIQRAPNLYAAVSDSIETDLTLDQMISLALLAEQIPEDNIRTGVVGGDYIMFYETPEGARVLIPNRFSIGPYLEYVFWLGVGG